MPIQAWLKPAFPRIKKLACDGQTPTIHATAQVQKAMEVTRRLGGEGNTFLLGDQEYVENLINEFI